MSGNVAMHLIYGQWADALAAIAAGLEPGGRLLFEARNPEARAWEQWQLEPTVRATPVGSLRESATIEPPDRDGRMVMHCHNEFADGEVVDEDLTLQFRAGDQIQRDLHDAGLEVVDIFATWAEQPFTGGAEQPLMIFSAHRPDGRP